MLIPRDIDRQVRERLQMIVAALELDEPEKLAQRVKELDSIVKRYVEECKKPRL